MVSCKRMCFGSRKAQRIPGFFLVTFTKYTMARFRYNCSVKNSK